MSIDITMSKYCVSLYEVIYIERMMSQNLDCHQMQQSE